MLRFLKKILPSHLKIKILDFLYTPAPITRLGIIFNSLGGNVLRLVYFQFFHFIRKTPSSAQGVEGYVKELKSNGVLRIDNFLSESDFLEVKNEYKELYPLFNESKKIKIPVQKRLFMSKSRLDAVEQVERKSSKFRKLLIENEELKAVISKVSKRSLNLLPHGVYSEEYYPKEFLGDKSQSKVINPHYDVPYHSYKAFLYIDDVDETNGAFHYSIGSNRLNFRRALLEYLTSINMIKTNNLQHVDFSHSRFFTEYEESMTPMLGKENTLVIFDARGIHQRGSFSTDKPRRMAQVCYRLLDSPANHLTKLIRLMTK